VILTTKKNEGKPITSATRPSAAAVVSGGHLSARAAFRLEPPLTAR